MLPKNCFQRWPKLSKEQVDALEIGMEFAAAAGENLRAGSSEFEIRQLGSAKYHVSRLEKRLASAQEALESDD